ncbi:MAG: choice-of-anchor A family protein [Oligoflexia bacterium]|nr:choice-of-anchor A family protein [Oligoflexia bacterium]
MILSYVLLILSIQTSFANSNLQNFLVFSKTSIQSQSSDYQGHTGALGSIELHNYEIAGYLASASSIQLIEGSVRGYALAPKVSLKRATAKRAPYSQELQNQLQAASYEIDSLSLKLASFQTTATVERSTITIEHDRVVHGLKFSANKNLEIIDIRSEELEQTNNLIFDGEGLLLVRIHGKHIDLQKKGTYIISNIRPEQIVFFFPDAQSIELSYSGGARNPVDNTHWGIPGSIVAPKALVHFAEILVTGQMYVGQICTENGLNGGQVNASYSILLKELLSGCAKNISGCRR